MWTRPFVLDRAICYVRYDMICAICAICLRSCDMFSNYSNFSLYLRYNDFKILNEDVTVNTKQKKVNCWYWQCFWLISFFRLNIKLRDSRNYMPPIHVPSSAKRITTQILVIANLNGRKEFILRVFVCDMIRPSKDLPVQSY